MTIGASPLQSIQTPDLLQERLARLKDEFPDLFTNEGQLNPAELLRLTGQQGREHFDFQWWGKSEAKRKAFTPTTAALRYDEARSVNPDRAGGNAIIEGENLEVLKLLLCAYRGQVKCIYIEECLLGCVTLLCNPKGRSQDKYFATNHEYIVAYSKTVLPKGALSVAKQVMQIQTDYPEVDEDGERFRYLELRNTHREFGKHNRKNLYYPFYVKPNGDVCLEPLVNAQAIFPDWEDGFQGCWTWEKKKAVSDLKLLAARKVKDRWKIYRKSYAEGSERMLKTIFADSAFYTSTGQREFNQIFESKEKIFQSPKSPLLIKELLDVSCDEKELVLDFFAGSGSLFHAALMSEKKRQVISVQISEVTDYKSEAHKAGFKKISDITIERVKRVIQGYGDNPVAVYPCCSAGQQVRPKDRPHRWCALGRTHDRAQLGRVGGTKLCAQALGLGFFWGGLKCFLT